MQGILTTNIQLTFYYNGIYRNEAHINSIYQSTKLFDNKIKYTLQKHEYQAQILLAYLCARGRMHAFMDRSKEEKGRKRK